MKLFKTTLKSLTSAIAVIAVGASMIAIPTLAATNGNVVYTHGENTANKQTFGLTVSTAVESMMRIDGEVYFLSGSNNGRTIPYTKPDAYNTKNHNNYITPGSVKGSSYFIYYVNNIREHQSTDWWNFDFR